MILATRTRKARRQSRCLLCLNLIETGQQIALITTGWAHAACVVAINRAAP